MATLTAPTSILPDGSLFLFKKPGIGRKHLITKLLQWTNIISYPDTPAVRTGDEIIFSGVYFEVVNRDSRQIAYKEIPGLTLVDGKKYAGFGSDKKEIRIFQIFADNSDYLIFW